MDLESDKKRGVRSYPSVSQDSINISIHNHDSPEPNVPVISPSTPQRPTNKLGTFGMSLRRALTHSGHSGQSSHGGIASSAGTHASQGAVRLSGLHQVFTSYSPESSPISPSVSIGLGVRSRNGSVSGSIPGSTWSSRSKSVDSPTSVHYRHSSSVSSLGLETGFLQDAVHDDSSSSEEMTGYDSDDMMIGGNSGSIRGRTTSSSIGRTAIKTKKISLSAKGNPDTYNPAIVGSSSTLTPSSSPFSAPATIRHLVNTGRSLKPKVKSFLRISQELQEELSPLDFEMRHENEFTSTFREEEFFAQKTSSSESLFKFDEEDRTSEVTGQQSQPWTAFKPQKYPEENEFGVTEYLGKFQKRKASIIDDSFEPSTIKRRAVSPGYVSPVSGSPTMSGAFGAKRNIKHMQNTSEDLQKMSLM